MTQVIEENITEKDAHCNAKKNQQILRVLINSTYNLWKSIEKSKLCGKGGVDSDVVKQKLIISNILCKQISLQTQIGIQFFQYRKIS